jgi:integrase
MGWAESTPTGYRACYRSGGKRIVVPKLRWSRKADAVRAANAAEEKARDHAQREVVDHGAITWAEWCDTHWWPNRKREESTLKSDKPRVDCHLRPEWGEKTLREIEDGGKSEIERWAWRLHEDGGLAASTVHKCIALLSASLTAAMTANPPRIARNPCKRAELPTIPPAEERFFTREQMEAILSTLVDLGGRNAEMLIKVKLNTGFRWGEVVGLHRHRVHLAALRIDAFESYSDAARWIKPYPKGERMRSVPISREFATELEAWLDERPADRRCGVPHAPGSQCRSGLVVPGDQNGGVVPYDNFYRYVWLRALELAGIEKAGLHVVRHTYATWLIRSGVPKNIVQILLGHVDPKTTNRYTHEGESGWAKVRAVMVGAESDEEALRRRVVLDALRLIAAATPDQRGAAIRALVGDDVDLAEFATILPPAFPTEDQKLGVDLPSSRSSTATRPGWGGWGSNPRPRDYESPALTN